MIEARRVSVAAEVGGKIVEVLVEEGQPVTRGQPLVRLDDSLLKAQRAQALAALQAAQANLALLKAGATDDQLKAAEAQVAQAEANLSTMQANLYTLTAGSRPEEIAAAHANLERARTAYFGLKGGLTAEQIEKARSALTTAESNLSEAAARKADLEKDTHNPVNAIDAADSAIADAQAAVDAAKQTNEADVILK
jgi:multidrug resistance efflux pump